MSDATLTGAVAADATEADLVGVSSASFNDQFLLAEDKALKIHLGGMTVSDKEDNSRPVNVKYALPDPEISKQVFPFITIDLLDVAENLPQTMTSWGPIRTDADTSPCISPDDYLLAGEVFDDTLYAPSINYGLTPMLLTYQITTWSRYPRHDRAIIAQLTAWRLHPRFAQITVGCTLRRLIVLNVNKRDTFVNNKRLFRNVWTIQIPSEVFYSPVVLTRRAESVMINPEIPQSIPDGLASPLAYPEIS